MITLKCPQCHRSDALSSDSSISIGMIYVPEENGFNVDFEELHDRSTKAIIQEAVELFDHGEDAHITCGNCQFDADIHEFEEES